MSSKARIDRTESGRVSAAAALSGAALLVLIAAGGLLWASQGDAVFTDMMTAALAWCF